jgi:hypothetical protein
MRLDRLVPIFVENIPEQLDMGRLYISEEHDIAIHKCCCGCGEEVVTPLTPVDWRIVKGRDGVSLFPSIGNWSYQCKSHYVVRNNQILWANQMSITQIDKIRQRDLQDKHRYIRQLNSIKVENNKQDYDEITFLTFIKTLAKKVRLFIRNSFYKP